MSSGTAPSDRAPNRLARETSPYLLQHQFNPVDWYPWGDEALARAKAEDKPIVLSVGYSACHWCHVMERESFEDPATAAVMNEHFVNVKVDREERPDVDAIYMQAVQALTGHGGWPMTVFLTPEGVPFYGGTYFPPEDRHGLPSFRRVLLSMAEVYREQRGRVQEAGRDLLEHLRQGERVPGGADLLTTELLHRAFQQLRAEADGRHGGLGRAPKFPQPMTWDFVLRYWRRTGTAEALTLLRTTLTRMARGGMYDQLGGGFHRYSVDAVWLVPHFEKMLYDQSQLALLYLHAWQATGEAEYRRIAEETLDYVVREMTDPAGGFYSTQDADSEGEEGKFFLWTDAELAAALEPAEARAAAAYWAVADGPNFEHTRNILQVPREPEEVAAALGLSRAQLDELVGRARRRLFAVREQRIKPGRDEKVLAGWNGMMLRAFAEASRVLARADYREVAERNAAFLLRALRPAGRLLRTWKAGQAKLLGYLEDHAMVADGLVALYEATFERRWLDEARGLADAMERLFWDSAAEAFFDTGSDHEALIVRPRSLFDSAVPCGTSVAADVLLRLAVLTGEAGYERTALAAIRPVAPLMQRYPSGFGRFLSALDFHIGPPVEVAVVWPAGAPAGAEPLLREVFSRYLPTRVAAGAPEGETEGVALLAAKTAPGGRATAYVCERYACQAPTTDPGELGRQLDARTGAAAAPPRSARSARLQ
jgi:uncharacterized protein YyaL (SSP411 family)